MKKIIVIGIATGSRDIETWGFGSHEEAKHFCKHLARTTRMNVVVIEGEIIGTYSIEDPPIKFTSPSDRHNNIREDVRQHNTDTENNIK